MRRKLVLVAFVTALLAGCVATDTPRGRLQLAVNSYDATMTALVAAYHAGLIPDEDVPRVEFCRQLAWGALQEYKACVLTGRPPGEALVRFNRAMTMLLAERAKIEGRIEGAD